MTTAALLSPLPRQNAFRLGASAPGALLTTSVSGSATPLATYTDDTLATENPTTLTASAAGLFGPIYLAFGVAYRFTLTDSLGNSIYQQDGIRVGGVQNSTFDVTDYGAVGNGSTDDTAAVQLAIDAAAGNTGGGLVYFPAGTYKLTSTLTCTTSLVRFAGAGRSVSILSWTDTATKGLTIIGSSAAVNTAFSANAAIGDRTVSVVSAAGLAIGGYAYMQDSGSRTGSFLTRIRDISGTTITLENAMAVALTTAATATFFSYTALLQGIDIRDLTFQCVNGASTANKLTLLELRRCEAFRVDNCDFNGSVAPLITPITCLDGLITRCRLLNGQGSASSGVEIQTSTGVAVTACTMDYTEFGVTPARSPYTRVENCRISGREAVPDGGRGIRFSDGSNFCRSVGNSVSDNVLFGIYFQDCAYCTSTGDSVSFNGVSSSPGEHGIVCGGFLPAASHHNTITGATIRGSSGYGILVTSSDGSTPEAMYTTISGCNISGCVQGAIAVQAGNFTSIVGGTYSAPGATTVGGILRITASAAHCLIANINVTVESSSTNAISTSGGDGTNTILHVITTLPIDTHANDLLSVVPSTWASTTQVATGANTTETLAWLAATIPGGTFKNARQGFELTATFQMAANGNNKTITAYVGTSTIVATTAGNNVYAKLRARGVWKSASNIQWEEVVLEGTAITRNTQQTSTDSWAADQPIKLTMTNGTANAGDITFIQGDLRIF